MICVSNICTFLLCYDRLLYSVSSKAVCFVLVFLH